LGKGTAPNSITETDIKLLGPRLKSISDAFMKNTADRDKGIKEVEIQFTKKIAEMQKAMDGEKHSINARNEDTMRRLEQTVVEERALQSTLLEQEKADHAMAMSELETSMDEKMARALSSYQKNEEAFKLKQNTILSALKKSVSLEQDEHMQVRNKVLAREGSRDERDEKPGVRRNERASRAFCSVSAATHSEASALCSVHTVGVGGLEVGGRRRLFVHTICVWLTHV